MAMQTNPLANLSLQKLKRAVAIRENIDRLEKELNGIVAGKSLTLTARASRRKGRLSAAARARISARMKARWAAIKGQRRLSSRSQPTISGPRSLRAAKHPSPPGQLKERIIRSLNRAGEAGATVKDLAAKLGTSYGNISVWFHTTAKGVKEIKKVAPGRFAWAP